MTQVQRESREVVCLDLFHSHSISIKISKKIQMQRGGVLEKGVEITKKSSHFHNISQKRIRYIPVQTTVVPVLVQQ